eukprot:5743994-Prymnesium_polylepis.1
MERVRVSEVQREDGDEGRGAAPSRLWHSAPPAGTWRTSHSRRAAAHRSSVGRRSFARSCPGPSVERRGCPARAARAHAARRP